MSTTLPHKRFSDNRIGICHIIPTFLLREKMKEGVKKNNIRMISEQIQYTVPIESTIKINLIRNANNVCMIHMTILKELQLESIKKYLLKHQTVSLKLFSYTSSNMSNKEQLYII